MSNVLVLVRRELGQTFRTPLAYVFLVLFLVLSQLLYVLNVFQAQSADLRPFFTTLPWAVIVFSALVSMRSWAEERQENTYEMLLTFPMRDWELAVAKFVSAFAVLALGIGATISLPILLLAVGDPDGGVMLAGYLGAFLLAGMWCAAGVFFSGLTRSQLLAALVSFVLGLGSLFVGLPDVSSRIDAKLPGLGSFLGSVLGTWPHYDAFSRGVVELADVAFFALWIGVFLYLSTLHVKLRRDSTAKRVLAVGTALALGCGLLGGRLLSDWSLARLDLTEERLYTLSDATLRIVEQAESAVQVKLYISPEDDMPASLKTLEREITSRLAELRVATNGRIIHRVVHMEAANALPDSAAEGDAAPGSAASIEKRLLAKGVRPFSVETVEATGVSTRLVYATLGLTYRERDEELIPGLRPSRLQGLEYRIASAVARLLREAPPRIALYLGPPQKEPEILDAEARLGKPWRSPYELVHRLLELEKFDVVRTTLTAHDPPIDDCDALVVIGPSYLEARQAWEINRALLRGTPVLIAAQRSAWGLVQQGDSVRMESRTVELGVDEVLAAQGLGFSRRMLFDAEKARMQYPMPPPDTSNRTVFQPHQLLVTNDAMNQHSVITQRLSSMLVPWPTAVEYEESKVLAAQLAPTVLFHSSARAWEIDPVPVLLKRHRQQEGRRTSTYPLAVMVKGTFQDAFEGKERPAWSDRAQMLRGMPRPVGREPPAEPVSPQENTLFLMGSAYMFQDSVLPQGGNPHLLLNCLHAMTLDDNLLAVRSKQPRDRQFPTPSAATALFWSLVPLLFVPLVIVGSGVIVGQRRRAARARWNQEHGR